MAEQGTKPRSPTWYSKHSIILPSVRLLAPRVVGKQCLWKKDIENIVYWQRFQLDVVCQKLLNAVQNSLFFTFLFAKTFV